ncbi:MAG: hypothetical protein AABZ60_22080, partial [Planctomycetota bacterium]
MNERKLSDLQKEYRAFFLGKMRLYGVKSPSELSKEKKSAFFTEIKQDWAKIKLSKKEKKETYKRKPQTIAEEPEQTYQEKTTQESDKKEPRQIQGRSPQEHTKQIIKSEPNQAQTDDLRILFTPNEHFTQAGQYEYPVVKMPKPSSCLKLSRVGRSNQKGYKENDFFYQLKLNIVDIEISNNVHMVIPNFNKPYEPDIVLFDKSLNLYIDIEIDEPYDGYYRYPTHYINPEDEIK